MGLSGKKNLSKKETYEWNVITEGGSTQYEPKVDYPCTGNS